MFTPESKEVLETKRLDLSAYRILMSVICRYQNRLFDTISKVQQINTWFSRTISYVANRFAQHYIASYLGMISSF
jgi:hypothetical protein